MNLLNSISNEQEKKRRPQSTDTWSHCNFPVTTWVPCSAPVNGEAIQTRKLKQHHFTSTFLRSVWPKYHQPPATLAGMNEKETEIWVEILARFKGWTEARSYAESFKINGVTGCVLPYLSVKALRSELGILKLGHRLEIIAAIENSELTLINPSIVSIRPDAFFKSAKNFTKSNSRLTKKSETTNLNEKEVRKWLAEIPRRSSTSLNSRDSSISCGSTSSETNLTRDQDPQKLPMFKECEIWRPKDDMVFRYGMNSVSKNSVISKSKNWSIPPIELPPAMPGFEGKKEVDDLTMEFVRGGQERLSTILSNAKSEITASSGCKPLKKCWGSLTVEEVGGT